MNKGISTEIRRILANWSTISDVMDALEPIGAKEESVMQMISRMKRNGEIVSKDEVIYGRTFKSYKLSDPKNIDTTA